MPTSGVKYATAELTQQMIAKRKALRMIIDLKQDNLMAH
jgi:hypothetical protein